VVVLQDGQAVLALGSIINHALIRRATVFNKRRRTP